jgi:O-acetyl-ADP-ribose deacetylase (regulator of RNase III)
MNTEIFPTSSKGSIAGIGSRAITSKESLFIVKLHFCMQLSGYFTYSGAADGEDTSVNYGCLLANLFRQNHLNESPLPLSHSFIAFIPSRYFNGKKESDVYVSKFPNEAIKIATDHHQGWEYLPPYSKKLMTRNVPQVLGPNLTTPVKMVLCSTPDGAYNGEQTTRKTGGTGQAIRIASTYNIPTFNIKHDKHRIRFQNYIDAMRLSILSKHKVDIIKHIEDSYNNFTNSPNIINTDISEIPNQVKGSVIIHGCNCQNVKGAGAAKAIFSKYPEAYEADQKTKKGDRKKLGTYSFADIERNNNRNTIINAYTQVSYGRDKNKLNIDYKAIRNVFRKIKNDYPNSPIYYTKLGSGLGNGCWLTISNIINDELSNHKHTLVDFNG